MKIIFSPAKDMDLSQPVDKDWTLSEPSRQIIEAIQALSPDQVQASLKLSDQKLEEVLGYIEGWSQPTTYRAIDLYKGLAYRQLGSLSQDEEDFLQDHLLIVSALYGLIRPLDLIKPYRLDFQSSLKINGQTLKKHWAGLYDEGLEEGETVLNLASNEFADRLQKNRYTWIDFDFYEVENDKAKRHSTLSKKARGLLLKHLAQTQSMDALKNFSAEGFKYRDQGSSDTLYSFVRSKA